MVLTLLVGSHFTPFITGDGAHLVYPNHRISPVKIVHGATVGIHVDDPAISIRNYLQMSIIGIQCWVSTDLPGHNWFSGLNEQKASYTIAPPPLKNVLGLDLPWKNVYDFQHLSAKQRGKISFNPKIPDSKMAVILRIRPTHAASYWGFLGKEKRKKKHRGNHPTEEKNHPNLHFRVQNVKFPF